MKRISILLVVAVAAAACTNSGSDSTQPSAAVSTPTTIAGSTTSSTILDPSVSPVRAQLDWAVRLFNGGPLSEEVYVERFAEVFRLQVPYEEQFVPIVRQMEAVPGDWLLTSYSEISPTQAVGIIAAGDERAQVSVTVDPEVDNRIAGFFIQPAGLASTPDSFENAISRLQQQGTLRMLAAEVVDGACVPIEAVDAQVPMPIGSMHKLFVLGTLADAVDSGDVAWDDEITIRDELKSIPSGVLQDEPDGTVMTVREVAELMISISDNTATDHLMDLLGRERIEGQLADLGMADPALNIPFLTTMEFSALKVGPAAGLRQQYIDADVEGRRAILEQISDISPADLPLADFDEPLDPDLLEWFATPEDMCRVMVNVWNSGDPVVQEMLTMNPGSAPEPGRWETVAFKGGSEPGLMAATWLTIDTEGRTYVFTGSVVNTDSVLDDVETFLLLAAGRDLMGAPVEDE